MPHTKQLSPSPIVAPKTLGPLSVEESELLRQLIFPACLATWRSSWTATAARHTLVEQRSDLPKVEDQQGNVVLLRARGVVTGKTGDVLEKGVCEKSRRNITLFFQKLFAA